MERSGPDDDDEEDDFVDEGGAFFDPANLGFEYVVVVAIVGLSDCASSAILKIIEREGEREWNDEDCDVLVEEAMDDLLNGISMVMLFNVPLHGLLLELFVFVVLLLPV